MRLLFTGNDHSHFQKNSMYSIASIRVKRHFGNAHYLTTQYNIIRRQGEHRKNITARDLRIHKRNDPWVHATRMTHHPCLLQWWSLYWKVPQRMRSRFKERPINGIDNLWLGQAGRYVSIERYKLELMLVQSSFLTMKARHVSLWVTRIHSTSGFSATTHNNPPL